jgi:hypothetical protein
VSNVIRFSLLGGASYKLAALQPWIRLTLSAALKPSDSAFMADVLLFAPASLNVFGNAGAAKTHGREWRRGHDASHFDAARCKMLSTVAKVPHAEYN